jgi:1-acyl-sn-glycerol-3-phosphate acyltransferase
MQVLSLRGALRLARFAGITSLHTAEAVGRRVTAGGMELQESARRLSAMGASLTSSLGIALEVEGAPPDRGVLLVANHRSYVDAPIIASCTPALFMAKAEIAGWPIVGTSAQVFGTVFVQRDDPESRQRARAELRDRLDAGVSVVVFPEGTTTRGPGLRPFRPGPFQVAVDAGLPVMPVAIHYPERGVAYAGDDVFLPHFLSCFAARRVQARISFGPLMVHRDPTALRDACHRWIASALERVESQAPAPDGRPADLLSHVNTRMTAAMGEPAWPSI